MRFDDWMLALHVLSAFSLVAGLVVFWALIVVGRRIDTPEATLEPRSGGQGRERHGRRRDGRDDHLRASGSPSRSETTTSGTPGSSSRSSSGSSAAALGRKTGEAFLEGPKKAMELQEAGQTGPNAELLALNRTSRGLLLQTLTSLVVLLIILDMIWKPWA